MALNWESMIERNKKSTNSWEDMINKRKNIQNTYVPQYSIVTNTNNKPDSYYDGPYAGMTDDEILAIQTKKLEQYEAEEKARRQAIVEERETRNKALKEAEETREAQRQAAELAQKQQAQNLLNQIKQQGANTNNPQDILANIQKTNKEETAVNLSKNYNKPLTYNEEIKKDGHEITTNTYVDNAAMAWDKPVMVKEKGFLNDIGTIFEEVVVGGMFKGTNTAIEYVNKVYNKATGNESNWANYEKISNDVDYNSYINKQHMSNPLTEKISELSPSIGQSALGLMYTVITGNPQIGSTVFGLSAAGGYYEQAKQMGLNEEQSLIFGGILGSLEGLTENIINKNRLSGLKSFQGDDMKKVLNSFGVAITENALQEAVMEPLQEMTSLIVGGKEHTIWKDDETFSDYWKSTMELLKKGFKAGIDGALMEILMAGAGAGLGASTAVLNKMQKGEDVSSTEIQKAVQETEKAGIVKTTNIIKDAFKAAIEMIAQKESGIEMIPIIQWEGNNPVGGQVMRGTKINVGNKINADVAIVQTGTGYMAVDAKTGTVLDSERATQQEAIDGVTNKIKSLDKQSIQQIKDRLWLAGTKIQAEVSKYQAEENATKAINASRQKQMEQIQELTSKTINYMSQSENRLETENNAKSKGIVEIKDNIYNNIAKRKQDGALNEYLKNNVKGQDYYVDGQKIMATKHTLGKLRYGNTLFDNKIDKNIRKELKANVIANIKSIVETSKIYQADRKDTKNHEFADTFDRRKSYFSYKGQNYEIMFEVGKKDGKNTLYGIEHIKKISNSLSQDTKVSKSLTKSDDPTVPNKSIAKKFDTVKSKERRNQNGEKRLTHNGQETSRNSKGENSERKGTDEKDNGSAQKELSKGLRNYEEERKRKLGQDFKAEIIEDTEQSSNEKIVSKGFKEATGLDINIYKTNKSLTEAAFYSDNGIFVKHNPLSSKKAANFKPFHEFGHWLKNNKNSSWQKLYNIVDKTITQKQIDDYKKVINDQTIFETMSKEETRDYIINEIISDYMGNWANNVENWLPYIEQQIISQEYAEFLADIALENKEYGYNIFGTLKQQEQVLTEITNIMKETIGIKTNDYVMNKEEVTFSDRKDIETDNKGRTLSKEQQEFFKDSKVRDEEGNLLTMYHGSPNKFTIFDKTLSDEDNVLGQGFYFTEDWGAAQHYSTKQGEFKDGNVYESYLNITNPFTIDDLDTESLAEKIHEIAPNVDIMDNDYGVASTEKMTKYLIDNGYDGIKAGYETYVAFNSNQIKNIDNTNPTKNPDIRYSDRYDTDENDEYGFYSQLEKVIEEKMPTTANAQQIKGILNSSGIKQDEMKWIGLDDYLKAHSLEKITKQQVLDYTKANQIKIETVIKGANNSKETIQSIEKIKAEIAKKREKINDFHYKKDNIISYIQQLSDLYDELDRAKMKLASIEDEDSSKYKRYTMKGGKNYQEKLYTLPKISDTSEYKSPHWEEKNVLAHVRTQDFIDIDGKKVIFIEEIQSDMHQQGRKKGYITNESIEKQQQLKGKINELEREEYRIMGEQHSLQRKMNELRPDSAYDKAYLKIENKTDEEIKSMLDSKTKQRIEDFLLSPRSVYIATEAQKIWMANPEYAKLQEENNRLNEQYSNVANERIAIQSEYDKLVKINNYGILDVFPFKKNWHEFVLRRVINDAVSQGYDKVSWTTGKQQSNRYNLSRQIDSLYYQKGNELQEGQTLIQAFKDERKVLEKWVKNEELEDFIGKTMAEKILNSNKTYDTLSGVDLEVGGEGMKGFYDKIIPEYLNKYLKKWNSQVETITLKNADGKATLDQMGFKITEEMRNSIKQNGQPLYSDRSDLEDNSTEENGESKKQRKERQEIAKKIKERKFFQNVYKSAPTEFKAELMKNRKQYEYVPISNKDTFDLALTTIRNTNNIKDVFLENELKSAEDTAIGEILIQEAIESGDYKEANSLTASLAEKLTNAGQIIQAAAMFRRMTPEGMLLFAEKKTNQINKELEKKFKLNKLLTKKNAPKIKMTEEKTQFINSLMKEMQELEEKKKSTKNGTVIDAIEREEDVIIAKIVAKIGEDIPTTMTDKLASWRNISLLLNTKTIMRNLVSNTMFSSIENLVDVVGVPLDKAIALATGERSLMLPNLKTQAKGFKKGLDYAIYDTKAGISTSLGGNKYEIKANKNFKNKTLQALETISYFGVEGLDRPFMQAKYESALEMLMKLEGLKYGRDIATEDIKQQALEIAKYTTFKDKNAISDILSKVKRTLNANKAIGAADVLGLTYTNVPGNLTKKAIDYSPVGLYNVIKKAFEMNSKRIEGEAIRQTQRELVQATSRFLIGTGIMAVSVQAFLAGVLTASGEEEDDKVKALTDQENYAINISAFLRWITGGKTDKKNGDLYVTYSNYEPLSSMIAAATEMTGAAKEGDNPSTIVYKGLTSWINSIAELSTISNFSSLFEYGDLGGSLTRSLSQFPASFIPTTAKQIAQLFETNSKANYSDNFVERYLINPIKQRMPGVISTLESYYDTMGNEEESYNGSKGLARVYNVFLNTSYTSTVDMDATEQELYDLYLATGSTDHLPLQVKNYFTYKGEKINLTSKEKAEYQKQLGQKTAKAFKEKMATREYKNMTDTEKVDALKSIINEINQEVKSDVVLEPRGLAYDARFSAGESLSSNGYKLILTEAMKKEYEQIASKKYQQYEKTGLYSEEKLKELKTKSKEYAKQQLMQKYKSKVIKSK